MGRLTSGGTAGCLTQNQICIMSQHETLSEVSHETVYRSSENALEMQDWRPCAHGCSSQKPLQAQRDTRRHPCGSGYRSVLRLSKPCQRGGSRPSSPMRGVEYGGLCFPA